MMKDVLFFLYPIFLPSRELHIHKFSHTKISLFFQTKRIETNKLHSFPIHNIHVLALRHLCLRILRLQGALFNVHQIDCCLLSIATQHEPHRLDVKKIHIRMLINFQSTNQGIVVCVC